MDIFTRPIQEYKREINPLVEYKKQAAFYLSKTKHITTEEALSKLDKALADKQVTFQDPPIVHYHRGENGDREIQHNTLFGYIRDTVVNNYVPAPTFTNYIPENVRKSPIVDFVDLNVKNRSVAKKAGFKAKIAKDMVTFHFMNNRQNNLS